MATTTNFAFNTPDNTDLVTNGALAIRTALNNVDSRFGDITNFPNQLVNVSSGVSRPLPFAMSAGNLSISGTAVVTNGNANATVTFVTSTRFTQTPIITVSQTSLPAGSGSLIPKISSTGPTGFTAYFYNVSGTTQSWSNATFAFIAVQMTSASGANS